MRSTTTEAEQAEMRRLREEGLSLEEIGYKYGITASTVRHHVTVKPRLEQARREREARHEAATR